VATEEPDGVVRPAREKSPRTAVERGSASTHGSPTTGAWLLPWGLPEALAACSWAVPKALAAAEVVKGALRAAVQGASTAWRVQVRRFQGSMKYSDL
jgi:hypothetical protein